MMLMDKKKMAATIVSGLEKGPEVKEVNMEKPEKDADSGLIVAAEDILSAIKSGNAKALSSALKAHRDLCDYEEDESEGESGMPTVES